MKITGLNCVLALGLSLLSWPAVAQEKLVVSTWGGNWRDMIHETISKRFTAETGVPVEYVTGITFDRLNKARLVKDNPETDIVFTTGHVGWLYASGGLFEKLDTSKLKNFPDMYPVSNLSPYHVGLWSYVYTIAYRPDLVPADLKFTSWRDLWDPRLKSMLSVPDADPSPVFAVAANLAGADLTQWEKGEQLLLDLKPNIKAFYSSGAVSQEKIISGETPAQIVLSGNVLDSVAQGHKINVVVPKEGAVLSFDAVAINANSRRLELAYKYLDIALSPEAQVGAVKMLKLGPMNAKTVVPEEYANLPGILTSEGQLKEQAIIVDEKLRAEKLDEWKQWFNENIVMQ